MLWDEWSLTTKLLAIMMTLMLLALSGTSAWVLENLRASLIERTDERLTGAAQTLVREAASTVAENSRAPLQTAAADSSTQQALSSLLPGAYYVQFYGADGQKVYSPYSPSVDNVPNLPAIDAQTVQAAGGEPMTVSGSKSQWRVVAYTVRGTDLYVAVGVPFDKDIDEISEYARNTMAGIGLLALAIVAGVGYFAITNTFRPLKDIEETASRIAAGDLSQRVTVYPAGTELGRLSASLNTMLGHIEDSFDGRTRSEKRIRQFVSDASHELRTPLVTIRGYAELFRQGAIRDPEQVGQAMERIEAEAKRMGVLVEDLVVLARLDERRQAETGPVRIDAIVRDAAADAAAQAPDREISFIGLDGEDAQPVPAIVGSEPKLRQVIVNLAGNAVRHTPDGSAIEFAVGLAGVPQAPAPEAGARKAAKPGSGSVAGFVTGPVRIFNRGRQADERRPRTEELELSPISPDVTSSGVRVSDALAGFPAGRVRFEVRDHGEGIDPDDVPRIFERFFRLDASRTRDTGGSGLGLSIVKAIVESHQGQISVHPTPGGGATFRVDLPIPPESFTQSDTAEQAPAESDASEAARKDTP
nr:MULTISPECIES: ATP-binding protein [Brevibacterium]